MQVMPHKEIEAAPVLCLAFQSTILPAELANS